MTYFTLRLKQAANLCCLPHPVADHDADLGGGLQVVHLVEVERGVVLALRLKEKELEHEILKGLKAFIF